ncbi:hypothetical protein [Arthrobacter sp. JSM 101049]|uniref:hypothetical protein n=1 Tax=Arthrobacter sp. JSM 101049 TaxID=929097 RepID=UPI003563794B
MNEQQAIKAVAQSARSIDEEHFSVPLGGWPDQIGMALIDAVYSIRASYHAKSPTKGVLNRARAFREKYPESANDLQQIRDVGKEAIRNVMGNGKSSGRHKSVCLVEAADNLLSLDPPVRNARQLKALDPNHKRAYTSVRGLGWVTYEYFTMLLGQPGIKADTMIRRFVDTALEKEGLPPVDTHTARRIVEAAHAQERPAMGLSAFDHAIWLHQRTVSQQR